MNIGIVPVSAKPYHVGHHALVTRASDENDKVFLFVSTSDRKRKGEVPILGADMEKVWQEEIEKILPGNVTVTYGGSWKTQSKKSLTAELLMISTLFTLIL